MCLGISSKGELPAPGKMWVVCRWLALELKTTVGSLQPRAALRAMGGDGPAQLGMEPINKTFFFSIMAYHRILNIVPCARQ